MYVLKNFFTALYNRESHLEYFISDVHICDKLTIVIVFRNGTNNKIDFPHCYCRSYVFYIYPRE